jgi:PRA1 family protein 1
MFILFKRLTSPFLLFVVIAVVGGCYIIHLRNKDGKINLYGREIQLAQLYCVVGIISIPLFLLAGAGSAVFWIIGASVVCIVLHAIFYSRDNQQDDPFSMEMNIV